MEINYNNQIVDLRLQHPFNCIISGSSGSGKTHLLTQILMKGDKVVNVPFDRIVYCYGEKLISTFKTLEDHFKLYNINIQFVEGLPTDENLLRPFNPLRNNCLILDDLMRECTESSDICNYFTRTGHHRNISIFYLTQNFYQKGRYSTTITRNSSYIILFSSPNDFGQIKAFASQRFNPTAILDAYKRIIKRPRGYLLIDCTQTTPEKLRLRTNITGGRDMVIFYPKK
jgi:hypothetical protein